MGSVLVHKSKNQKRKKQEESPSDKYASLLPLLSAKRDAVYPEKNLGCKLRKVLHKLMAAILQFACSL